MGRTALHGTARRRHAETLSHRSGGRGPSDEQTSLAQSAAPPDYSRSHSRVHVAPPYATVAVASNFNMQKKLQRERTDQVNRYMRERGLGKALQRRIRAFYEYYLERKSVFDVAQMLDEVRRARIPSAYLCHLCIAVV